MEDYYHNVYLKRLNRYGIDYQSRMQRQREENFKLQLKKSVYYVEFEYKDEIHAGELTPLRQNETKTMQYLLTDVHLDMPNGTILFIPDKDMELRPWMIYYLEDIKASGYNRYIVIKMTHYLIWKDRDGREQGTWAYFYGQEDNMLKDELKSRSRNKTLYTENLKLSFFIMPRNEFLRKDNYMEVGEGPLKEAYVVTGYDIQSTPGVEFVSVDPQYVRDQTPPPEQQEEDDKDDFFWINKGVENDG
jgi:hypothetical protein